MRFISVSRNTDKFRNLTANKFNQLANRRSSNENETDSWISESSVRMQIGNSDDFMDRCRAVRRRESQHRQQFWFASLIPSRAFMN